MPNINKLNKALKSKAAKDLKKKIDSCLNPITTMLGRQNITKYDSQIKALKDNIIDELLPTWEATVIKNFLIKVDKLE
jgi:hypothetical protein